MGREGILDDPEKGITIIFPILWRGVRGAQPPGELQKGRRENHACTPNG